MSNPWVIICHIWSSKNLFQGLCHSLGSNLPNLAMTHCVQSIKTSAQHANVEQQYWSRLHHDSFSTSRTTASLLERSISVGQVVYPAKFKVFFEYNGLMIRKHCFLWSKPPKTSHETVEREHAKFFILHHLCIALNHLSAARMSRSFHVNVAFSFSNSSMAEQAVFPLLLAGKQHSTRCITGGFIPCNVMSKYLCGKYIYIPFFTICLPYLPMVSASETAWGRPSFGPLASTICRSHAGRRGSTGVNDKR